MNLRERSNRRREHPEMEMTPLIDVVFLLLIFFLVTATFAQKRESSLPVDLPEAATGTDSDSKKPVVVRVAEDGSVAIEAEVVPETGDLTSRLRRLHRERPDAVVSLRGDKSATHGRTIEVLDAIRRVGFERVRLITEETDSN
ncbi:MAG: ExbD/TolR family protein [Bradymonadaceae bacterium]